MQGLQGSQTPLVKTWQNVAAFSSSISAHAPRQKRRQKESIGSHVCSGCRVSLLVPRSMQQAPLNYYSNSQQSARHVRPFVIYQDTDLCLQILFQDGDGSCIVGALDCRRKYSGNISRPGRQEDGKQAKAHQCGTTPGGGVVRRHSVIGSRGATFRRGVICRDRVRRQRQCRFVRSGNFRRVLHRLHGRRCYGSAILPGQRHRTGWGDRRFCCRR